MKNIHIITFAATAVLASIALASCVETERKTDAPSTEIGVRPVGTSATKSAIDGTTLPTERTLTVTAYWNSDESSSSGEYFRDERFSHDAGLWRCVEDPKYWPMDGTLDIFAWSADGLSAAASRPVDTITAADGVILTVPDNSNVQSDIVFGAARRQSKTSTGTPFLLHHAEALLCWIASTSMEYDATTNYGFTIDGITVDGAYHAGKAALACDNETLMSLTGVPEAEDAGRCLWSFEGVDPLAAVAVPDNGVAATAFPYTVPPMAMDIAEDGCHFGIGGLGLLAPAQPQSAFSVRYTFHNGFDGDGQPNDHQSVFTYNCEGVWEAGRKYVYVLDFEAAEILVSPTVTDWNGQTVYINDRAIRVTGNTVERVGEDFTFDANDIYWWRPDVANDYVALSGGIGTWGDEVTFATSCYLVTVRRSGTSYTVSYEKTLIKDDYFWIEAVGDIVVSNPTTNQLYYSTDHSEWQRLSGQLRLPAGNAAWFRANATAYTTAGRFTIIGRYNIGGNIASLLVGDNFRSQGATATVGTNCFLDFFKESSVLDASLLELPMLTVGENGYKSMFHGCSLLTKAPKELPATSLNATCYRNMFYGCAALTETPVIKAPTKASGAFQQMFYGCAALTKATLLTENYAENDFKDWMNGVPGEGVFIRSASAVDFPRGVHGIPASWTVINYGE